MTDWTLPERDADLIARYGHLLNNTGGNDPADLLRRLATEKGLVTTNLPVFVLAVAMKSQLGLLDVLDRQARLLTDEAAQQVHRDHLALESIARWVDTLRKQVDEGADEAHTSPADLADEVDGLLRGSTVRPTA